MLPLDIDLERAAVAVGLEPQPKGVSMSAVCYTDGAMRPLDPLLCGAAWAVLLGTMGRSGGPSRALAWVRSRRSARR